MYAMLTGNLPFTVEPFNIKALYNKMLNAEMNPIPEHLSMSEFTEVLQNHHDIIVMFYILYCTQIIGT